MLTITIAPNPVVAQETFSLAEGPIQEGLLQAYHAQGQLMHRQEFSDHRFSWDAMALPSGTYFHGPAGWQTCRTRGEDEVSETRFPLC